MLTKDKLLKALDRYGIKYKLNSDNPGIFDAEGRKLSACDFLSPSEYFDKLDEMLIETSYIDSIPRQTGLLNKFENFYEIKSFTLKTRHEVDNEMENFTSKDLSISFSKYNSEHIFEPSIRIVNELPIFKLEGSDLKKNKVYEGEVAA